MNLADFRRQHPEYNDLSDRDLADALHAKYYADVPRDQFDQQVGVPRGTTAAQGLSPNAGFIPAAKAVGPGEAIGTLAKAGLGEMGEFAKGVVEAPVSLAKALYGVPKGLVLNPLAQTLQNRPATPQEEQETASGLGGLAGILFPGIGRAMGAGPLVSDIVAGGTAMGMPAATEPNATPASVAGSAAGGMGLGAAFNFLLPGMAGRAGGKPVGARARLKALMEQPPERMPEPAPPEAALASRLVARGPTAAPAVPAPVELPGPRGAATYSGADWEALAAREAANTPEARLARSIFGPAERQAMSRWLPSMPTLPPVRVPAASSGRIPAGAADFARTTETGQNILNPEPGSPEEVLRARMLLDQISGRTARVESRTGGALATPPGVHLLPGEESPYVRMAGEPPKSAEPLKRGLRQLVLGYHNPSPLAAGEKLSTGQSLNDVYGMTKRPQQDAEETAAVEMERFLRSHLTGEGMAKPDQANLVRKYMTAMSFLSDAEKGKPLPSGYSPQQLERDVTESAINLSKNPEAQRTADALRADFKAMREDMTRRGYNMGEIEHYMPAHGFETLDRLLPEAHQRFGTTPSFMRQRGPEADLRNADVFKLMADYRTSYLKKRAEDEMFTTLAADPKINLAADPVMAAKMAREGVPKGYVQYTMPPGAPGHGKFMVDPEGKPVLGPDGQPKPYTMVVNRNVAESLAKFYPPRMGEAAETANRIGSAMARSATTYHLGNRAVNFPSDLWMTLAGPAGEKGTFTKGLAAKRLAAVPGALRDMLVGEMGHPNRAYEEGRRLGAVSGTFQHEIRGTEVPHGMKDYYYPEAMSKRAAPMQVLKNVLGAPGHAMKRLSTVTEAAPRLAALKPALKAGVPDEAARELVHESSLPYGSGASQFSKSPLSKLTSRFSAYPSLADVRIAKGLVTPGSRARYLALATIPPAVAAQWNTQDEAYSKYEVSLKPWVKQSLHFNRRLPDGKFETIVVRIDPFSEAMNRWGLGQLSGRVVKDLKGVEPLDLSTAPQDALRAYADLYPLGPIVEDVQGKTFYGKNLPTALDKLSNLLPVVRVAQQTAEAAKKGGPAAAAKEAARRTVLSGARPYTAQEVVDKTRKKKAKK